MDERIAVSPDRAGDCRCADCATFKLNELSGGLFCANGPSKKSFDGHNGCNCQGCPIRTEGEFEGILWCSEPAQAESKMAPPRMRLVPIDEPANVDLTMDTVGGAAGAVEVEKKA